MHDCIVDVAVCTVLHVMARVNFWMSAAMSAMLVVLLPSVAVAAHVQQTDAFLCGPDVLIFLPDVLLQVPAAVCVSNLWYNIVFKWGLNLHPDPNWSCLTLNYSDQNDT